MKQEIEYDDKEKALEWQFQDYCFQLADSAEQLSEIDDTLQISVNQARMDLIISKQIIPVYVKKIETYKIMILLKIAEDTFLLDYCCGEKKSVPSQEEFNIIKTWCKNKNITLSNGVRL